MKRFEKDSWVMVNLTQSEALKIRPQLGDVPPILTVLQKLNETGVEIFTVLPVIVPGTEPVYSIIGQRVSEPAYPEAMSHPVPKGDGGNGAIRTMPTAPPPDALPEPEVIDDIPGDTEPNDIQGDTE